MPDWTRHIRPRLSALRLSPARENEIVDELSQHLEDRWRELVAGGASEDDATRQALALFRDGNWLEQYLAPLAQARAPVPVTPGVPAGRLIRDAWQDLRYAGRTLGRQPAFALSVVLTLALGIGANTGIFTVVNAVLFREVTAPRADELVSISQAVQGVPDRVDPGAFTTAEYLAYRDRARTLSGLVAYGTARGETTLGGDPPRKVLGALVSCNYFDVLQQPPVLGRALAAPDCEPGAELVVVLSHELWRSAFGADPAVVGRAIRMNRQQVTVAGVGAEGTYNGSSFIRGGYIAPLNAGRLLSSGDSRYENEQFGWLTLLGRRRDGATLDTVRAELAVVAGRIDRQQTGRATTLAVDRAGANDGMPADLRGAAAGGAAVLAAAFGFILLIACANVANLLLARGTSRSHEIGIRAALGASRARVVRQLVTESLLLSLVGGLLGSVVAVWACQALVSLVVPALLPPWLPLALAVDVQPDLQVIAFAVSLTVVTGLLFGLVPAWVVTSPDLHSVMKQDAPGGGSGRWGGRMRGTLVGVQVALCMVLMMAAGLVLRGLHASHTSDPGFAYEDVALVSLESVFDGYGEEEARGLRERLVADLRAIPGVEGVAATDHKPLGDDRSPRAMRLPGERQDQSRIGEAATVTEDYFPVMGLPIVRGRAFTEADVRSPGRRPVIVSETTARNLWPGDDPIGQALIAAPVGLPRDEETLEVVGVVADAQVSAIGRIDPYYLYVPGRAAGALLVKGRADVATTVSEIRAAIRAVDPTLLVTVLPLEATLGWLRGVSATVTALFGALGVVALVLASVGIYGVVSYAVVGRRREFGIRLALGATAGAVLGMIVRQTMRPVVVGAAIGIALAGAGSRLLSSVLFGVSPADPVGLGGATLFVLGVALATGLLGAWPVTRADPTATLRQD
jgi:predicted permease